VESRSCGCEIARSDFVLSTFPREKRPESADAVAPVEVTAGRGFAVAVVVVAIPRVAGGSRDFNRLIDERQRLHDGRIFCRFYTEAHQLEEPGVNHTEVEHLNATRPLVGSLQITVSRFRVAVDLRYLRGTHKARDLSGN